ncbi:MAG: hypothetical protein WC238_06120 [Parcubacteria group bacterium]|jgi:hypothetical protein
MKRAILLTILILLVAPSIMALNVSVQKISYGEVMIAGIDNPAVFTLNITNFGGGARLQFFNLLSFSMTPVEAITFGGGETKEINVSLWPIGEFNHMGTYTMTYFIKDLNTKTQVENSLTFKRIELKDAFEIGASSFDPDASSINVYIKNKENFDFGNVDAKLSSAFFNVDKKFTLRPREKKEFTIEINKDDFKQLLAGFYLMTVDLKSEKAQTTLSENLDFKEKNKVKTDDTTSGFIVRSNVIKKINEGNTVSDVTISATRNILSRLFTTFSSEPDIVDRQGLVVYYTWNKSIKPGETFEVTVKTNWTFPVILVILIVIIVGLTKYYTSSNLVLRKKVDFVNAKGGEFALKVSITVHARKYMENINIFERLPPLVKIYEKFGTNQPTRVDEKARRIDWSIDKLEVRVISYIIYSKVGVMGKFALPSARGVYEINGTIHETSSNRAFFLSEQRGTDLEED